jgi:biopolymer transport protein ExbD
MARRRRHPEPASTELNLTSMIDVVFQLLIYFIVGTSFAMGEQSYRMDLPERKGASTIDPHELDDEPVTVEVLGGGRITVPGPWSSPVSVEHLTAFLNARLSDGLLTLETPIRIRPKAAVPWGDAVQAFNAALAGGFETVGFEEPAP